MCLASSNVCVLALSVLQVHFYYHQWSFGTSNVWSRL